MASAPNKNVSTLFSSFIQKLFLLGGEFRSCSNVTAIGYWVIYLVLFRVLFKWDEFVTIHLTQKQNPLIALTHGCEEVIATIGFCGSGTSLSGKTGLLIKASEWTVVGEGSVLVGEAPEGQALPSPDLPRSSSNWRRSSLFVFVNCLILEKTCRFFTHWGTHRILKRMTDIHEKHVARFHHSIFHQEVDRTDREQTDDG